MQPIKNLQEAR
ncbi:hypothetical protein MXB_2853 [Myxobolus squamalis]|nr:hypothetical protein MXB_2853 [Myxobolus squamalis]